MTSLVKRLSKTLMSSRSSSSRDEQGSRQNDGADGAMSMEALRRQSTKELMSEEESMSKGKVTGRPSIRTSSIVREVSKSRTTTVTSMTSRQVSKRTSKAPSRLIEEEKTISSPRKEGILTKSASKPHSSSPVLPRTSLHLSSPSRQGSLSKTPSLNRSGSKGSMISKTPSRQSSLKKASSLSRSGSKGSMTKTTSMKAAAPITPRKKNKPGGKELWFAAGAYLTVRNDEGGFYLCRAQNNIYNTSKSAKIRWLGPKTPRGKKRGVRGTRPGVSVPQNAFELMYADQLDPATVLMEVEVDRKGTSYLLKEEDKQETDRLMQVAADVESGKMDKDDIGQDVEEAIQVDYEPPAKRRKLQDGRSPSPKSRVTKERKPRLKKTTSQKEREKTKKAEEREEKKQKKKAAADERKRKTAVKKDDTTLKPNPVIKIMEKDPLWHTTTHMPYVSKYSNSRLAFRAVHLGDVKMLKKLLRDADRIRSLDHFRNVRVQESPLEFAIKQGNKEMINLLVEDFFGSKFQERRKESHADRLLISRLGTGKYNYRSLGVGRIRPLMASRGAREGNNALIKDQRDQESFYETDEDEFLETVLLKGASQELVIKAMNNMEDLKDDKKLSFDYGAMRKFVTRLPTILARGFNEMAGQIMKVVQNGYHFSRVPSPLWKVLVAKDVSELPSIPPSSINLNIKTIKGFTMIHAAASNPNPDILTKVLNSDPNFLVSDSKGLRPVHIAAGCSSPDVLVLLLDKGANPYDADSQGETALHYAIHAGRTKNVEILLKLMSDSKTRFVDPTAGKPNGGVNRANRDSHSPLHLACQAGHSDMVNLLVKHGATIDVKTSLNALSVTPLMFAAGAGHLDIVRCLVDAGAVVEFRDRVGRTALMHAAMNGSTNIMSYLLRIGAGPNRQDTSGNTSLHYAAAYGWYFSVKLLLEAGADPTVSNDWRTTPLSVSYLKSHQGIVSLLLEDDRVDVNFPNEDGETLLFIACSSEKEEDLLEQIHYLIVEKGADCTVVNNSGMTPLHCLADTTVYKDNSYVEKENTIFTKPTVDEVANKVMLDVAKVLVENGCDVTRRDKTGYTPAMMALKKGNMKLAQYLVEKGSHIFSSLQDKKDDSPDSEEKAPDTLLHGVTSRMFDTRHGDPNDVITFLTKTWTVKGEKKSFHRELREMAATFDNCGNTPLLTACSAYSSERFSDDHRYVQKETWKWENAFTFIQNLVQVADSDVNISNRPHWKPFGERQPDANNREDYSDRRTAAWTPAFFMVQANDPSFSKNKKYEPTVKGRGLKFLLSKGAKVNVYDLNGHTPFTYALECKQDPSILNTLISQGKANVNLCKQIKVRETQDSVIKEVTYNIPPICITALAGSFNLTEVLLKQKVDVNAVNEQDQSNVLHVLATNRSRAGTLALMEKMLEAGVNINAVNKDKRTPLHLLVNSTTGRIDDSFEEEILLILHKANLAVRDKLGRIPLHYVFDKVDRGYGRTDDDPIDLCKLLVKSMKAADLNVADNSGCTPLHYAAQRGCSICCMYLMQKGANPDIKDKVGNTPLGLAVQARKDNCGCILIQNGADLLSPLVVIENAASISAKDNRPKEWLWKPLAKGQTKETKERKEVPLFQEAIRHGLVGVSFLILEWPVEKSGITLVDAVEMAVKNSQFNVALRLLSTVIKGSAEVCALREQKRNLLHVLTLYADPSNNQQQQVKVARTLLDKGVSASAKDRYGCTPLLYAAYNKNFQLAKFLADLPGVLDVSYTDGFDRNLVAASLWKSFCSGFQITSWIQMLINEDIDINCLFDYPLMLDVFGTSSLSTKGQQDPDYWQSYPEYQVTPLIYALNCKAFAYTGFLLKSGACPDLADSQSLTPLMHAVKLNSVQHVKQLLKYDYDPAKDDKDPEKPAKKPQKKKKQTVKGNVFRLTKRASDVTASESSEPSSEEEEEEVVKKPTAQAKLFKMVPKTSVVDVNAKDSQGWTALHYVACPLETGTFDNAELVFVLAKAGANLSVKNREGETPLDLALANSATKVAAMLQDLMHIDKKRQKKLVITLADVRVKDGVIRRRDYDFHNDADRQMAGREEEMEEEEPFEPEVSRYCNITNGTIARDEEQDLPYEVLMTKCDAHLGVWGLYNFYQIQLVHQAGKNLYVLFTRWGRIGDQGQYQHTPYVKKEEAVKEFCKIFRAKSGNKWQDVKRFEQKPRKYHLVPVEERRPPKKQAEISFDFSTKVKCTLPGHVHKAMNIMVNIETLQRSYQRDINVDTDVLPFGRFHRDRLLKASQLLEDMGTFVNNIAEYRKDSKNKTPEEKEQHQKDCEKVSDLSSDYFQLIPQKNFVYEQLRPLDRMNDYKRQFQLITNLLDFDVTTKMMLAAMHRKTEIHPLDYVYNVMKCKVELMEEGDPMTQNILRYAQLGGTRQRVEGVYKVEREGEEGRFQKCKAGNRRLLWHGTRLCNLVSILHRGLVATPLDANLTGQRFGKGIYFADIFNKSDNYVDSSQNYSSFMLLCEVALGKQWFVGDDDREDENNKKKRDSSDCESSLALGSQHPHPDYDVHLPSGEIMSLGDPRNEYYYTSSKGENLRRPSSVNEYIVYHEDQVRIRYLLQYRVR